jgi:hypothetical protein
VGSGRSQATANVARAAKASWGRRRRLEEMRLNTGSSLG